LYAESVETQRPRAQFIAYHGLSKRLSPPLGQGAPELIVIG
jgi:hypothetical protein